MAEVEIWSDLHPDFKVAADGSIKLVTNVEAVYASLENILLTILGSRVMLRRFAINPHGLLFEGIDNDHLRTVFAQEFKDGIERWEPRVKVESVDVQSTPDRQEVRIAVQAYIIGYEEVFNFGFVYKRGQE